MTNPPGEFARLWSDLVRAHGLSEFMLSVSAHTQTSRLKTQPILKLTDCEDVKSNIISVLIINQGTITGFASIHLLVFVCLYLHSKTSCCIKYGATLSVHMLMYMCLLVAGLAVLCQAVLYVLQAAGERALDICRITQPSTFFHVN